MRLLITGTGRCGTTWFTWALRAAGITDCGHETAFGLTRHGEGRWRAESSWPAAPYTPLPGTHVVHLVRHPLDTIRSRVTGSDDAPGSMFADSPAKLGRYVYSHAPEVARWATPLERCAAHWVAWNTMIAADEVLRIEDVTVADVNRLARIVDPGARGIEELPPPRNGRRDLVDPVGWGDVAHIPGLLDLAREYGYR